jgi:hypothetical protein
MSIQAICLLPNQSIKTILISSQLNLDNFNINELPATERKKFGKGDIQRECDFGYNDLTISIFAWTYGKAGRENKHELPPPIDNELYFGNIYVFAHKDGQLVNFTEEQYHDFYETAFGGFEDIGSEDEWSEEDEEIEGEFDDFIVSENYETNSISDEIDSDYETEEDFSETEEDYSETEEDYSETEEDYSETEEDCAEEEEDFSETEEDCAEEENDNQSEQISEEASSDSE